MVDVTGIDPVTPACKLGIEGSSQIRVVSDAPKLTNPGNKPFIEDRYVRATLPTSSLASCAFLRSPEDKGRLISGKEVLSHPPCP